LCGAGCVLTDSIQRRLVRLHSHTVRKGGGGAYFHLVFARWTRSGRGFFADKAVLVQAGLGGGAMVARRRFDSWQRAGTMKVGMRIFSREMSSSSPTPLWQVGRNNLQGKASWSVGVRWGGGCAIGLDGSGFGKGLVRDRRQLTRIRNLESDASSMRALVCYQKPTIISFSRMEPD